MDTNISLDAVRTMDDEVLTEIFSLYAPALYNYALRLCGDPMEADNVVGDVFAKFLEQLAAGKGPHSNLRSYLYQTAYHVVVDEARFSRRMAPLEVVEFMHDKEQTVLESVENRALLETLLYVMKNDLTDDQRNVITLRFLEGFSLRETAEIVGKDVNNIKGIQNRGISKLRAILKYRQDQNEYRFFTQPAMNYQSVQIPG